VRPFVIAWKELIQLRGDPQTVAMIFFLPLVHLH
jgi:hypothetical protein